MRIKILQLINIILFLYIMNNNNIPFSDATYQPLETQEYGIIPYSNYIEN